MSWKFLSDLAPEEQVAVKALFKPEELANIENYEFDLFGTEWKRRIKPALTTGAAPKPIKMPSKRDPAPSTAALQASPGEQIHQLPPGDLLDSPTQPRSHYDDEKRQELARSVREDGIAIPLVARIVDGKYELIFGHRRKRAAVEVGLPTVPVLLRTWPTEKVIEMQLVEIVQTEHVDPIDEARSLGRMLELTNAGGQRRFATHEAVADRIGKSAQHVHNRLRLLRCPREFQEAIHRGTVGETLGYEVAKVPDEKLRKKYAAEVLKGCGDGPMSKREAIDHRRANYMVELRNPPFDPKDPKLVPVKEKDTLRHFGGACTDCPFNSANMPEAGEQKIHMCTLPPCFAAKQTANVEHVRRKALDAGGIVVEGAAAEKYIFADGTPKPDSGMVNLDQVPAAGETTGDKKAPKWRTMVEAKTAPVTLVNRTDGSETTHETGVRVKPVVVIDSKGRTHELVERKSAVAAATQNGYEGMFKAASKRRSAGGGGGGGGNPVAAVSDNAAKERKKKEDAKKKLDAATAQESLGELVVAISKVGLLTEEAWVGLFEVALFHSALDAQEYVCTRRKLDAAKGHEKALRALVPQLTAERLPSLVIELLLAGWVKASGVDAPGFRLLAKAFALDLTAIRAKVKASLEEPKKKAKKAQVEKPEKPVRELIAELAKTRGIKTLADIDALSRGFSGKPYADLRGSELNQLVDAIKALPVEEKPPKRQPAGAPKKKAAAVATRKGGKQ